MIDSFDFEGCFKLQPLLQDRTDVYVWCMDLSSGQQVKVYSGCPLDDSNQSLALD